MALKSSGPASPRPAGSVSPLAPPSVKTADELIADAPDR